MSLGEETQGVSAHPDEPGEMVVRVEALAKQFDGHSVLCGVDFSVRAQTVHFVVGRSGVGKSVLLRLLVGLQRPDAGTAWVVGQEVTALVDSGLAEIRKRCQMIFQHATLFDGLTALENVAMPLRRRFSLSSANALARAREALSLVQADTIHTKYPAELSLGLRKRIAVARAIALEPEVLLLDEPTSSLDPVAARHMDRLIQSVVKQVGLSAVVVSHDLRSL